jgi:hypothetical protein
MACRHVRSLCLQNFLAGAKPKLHQFRAPSRTAMASTLTSTGLFPSLPLLKGTTADPHAECSHGELFGYTSGRWLWNEAEQLSRRQSILISKNL